MTFCQECGSEVAPNDTFCPFCGISLAAANQSAAVRAPENEHPIVTPPSPFDDSAPVFQSETGETAPSVQPTAAGDESEIDFSPLPAPLEPIDASPLEAFGSLNQAKQEFNFDDAEQVEDHVSDIHEKAEETLPPASAVEPENNAVEKTFGEKSEESASSKKTDFDESVPVGTFAPAESAPPDVAVQSDFNASNNISVVSDQPKAVESSGEPLDFDATIADVPPDSLKDFQAEDSPSIPVADSASGSVDEITAQTAADNAAPNISNDQAAVETPIFKPAEELELSDKNPPPNQFDSVRIFENSSFDNAAMSSLPSAASETVEPFSEIKSSSADEAKPEDSVRKDDFVEPPSAQINDTAAISESANHAPPATNNNGTNDSGGKKAAKLKPLDEGTVLNSRYEIIRKIGGGGMGAVYLATDNNLGGVLRAVKEMVQSYIEENQQEKAINDFKRESMILSTLDHPAIPTIYDYFYDDVESRFYLVMKYINGGDLSVKLRSTPAGKIDEKTVAEWGIQIADVLDYLHNRPTPVIYRDLKPANVMIDDNSGRVMLIDFGIARSVNKEEKGVTAVGTMGYAPPELFSGNVEPRSDIYSLGSTMFHLLTGADPQSNPLLIFDFQKNPRPRQINSQLSDQMERILMRAVEYNADARFENAGEMRRCLQEHLENFQRNNVTYGVKEVPPAVSLEDQPVFCGFCGQRIMATDMFCAFCGAKQPLSQKGVHSEIYARPITSAKVTVQGTNDLDAATYDLDKDQNLIGRRDPLSNIFPELDLSKYDPQTKVSRRHALIRVSGGSYTVEDLGSSNGTTVIAAGNSVRLLPHQPQPLSHGDKIRVGDTMLSFSAS